MKNYNIMGVYWKIQFLGEGVTKKQYIGANFLKSPDDFDSLKI